MPGSDPAATAAVAAFAANALLVVAGAAFGFYAAANHRRNQLAAYAALWPALAAAGVAATLHGGLGVLDAVLTGITFVALDRVLLLAFVVLVSLALREVYVGSAAAPPVDEWSLSLRALRRLETVLLGVVTLQAVALFLLGDRTVLVLVGGAGAAAFAVYGVAFAERVQSSAYTQGTVVDTLVRHLVPALVCAAFVAVGEVAVVAGFAPAVAAGLELVFAVMLATFLVAATVRLKQNVESVAPPA